MEILRKIASMLLLAAVGVTVGALTGVLATFYLYGIGTLLTVPIGLLLGGWLGWRTPLRDSVILFIACLGGGVLGDALVQPFVARLADDQLFPLYRGLVELSLPVLGALAGVVVVFLPVRCYVPFNRRRTLAAVLAAGAALWVLWQLYVYGSRPL